MKAYKLLIFSSALLILSSCSKDSSTSTPATGYTASIAGVTLPNADAGLYYVVQNTEGSIVAEYTAWIQSYPFSIDAGSIKYKIGSINDSIKFRSGTYVDYNPIYSGDTIFNDIEWNITGKGTFPNIAYKDVQIRPEIGDIVQITSPIAPTAGTFKITHGLPKNCDYLIYTLFDVTNPSRTKGFLSSSKTSTSYTFNNADFKDYIVTVNGYKGIAYSVVGLKYTTQTINGKKVNFVKQYSAVSAIEVL